MRASAYLFATLLLGDLSIIAQVPPTQAAPAAAQAPLAPTNVSDQQAEYTEVCKEKAIHEPAYEYCSQFAIALAGNDTADNDALKNIAKLIPDVVSLANAYSTYKANIVLENPTVDQADQKAAVNNGQMKQAGTPAAASGSTSLVGKAAATNLLAVAIESGALTQGQTGNTITLQANPADLFREAYLGTPQLSYLPVSSSPLENFTVPPASLPMPTAPPVYRPRGLRLRRWSIQVA